MDERYKISLHPAFEVAEIREESPAALAGIQKGDIIIAVNGKLTHRHSLQEVAEMLNEAEGKGIRLLVDRNGTSLRFFSNSEVSCNGKIPDPFFRVRDEVKFMVTPLHYRNEALLVKSKKTILFHSNFLLWTPCEWFSLTASETLKT